MMKLYKHSGTQTDAICRGCKQPYSEHIRFDGDKVCPWPKEYPKPDDGEKDDWTALDDTH